MVNDVPSSARMLAGRYRLGSRLGSSLEAAVFEAFDEQLQRTVVLKLVHPDLSDVPQLQQFFQSAIPVAAALHHPNIAVLHDWGTARWNERDVLYVATERLIGGSLRDLLDRGRLLSPSQALVVGLDACKALDALHRQGLIHTDVRPSTLVFGDDRRLRLVDVGLAQVLHDTVGDITARSMDRAKYSSPEEAQGLPLQPKSDVYSLCLTLLEAVTGSVPFQDDSTVATLSNRVDKLMAHSCVRPLILPTAGLILLTVYGPWVRPGMAPSLFSKNIDVAKADAKFSELLNTIDEVDLSALLRSYADEPRAARMAREITRRRERRPFVTADDLVDAIRAVLGPRSGAPDFARIFQAVRIAVNDELAGLERALPLLRERLSPGGTLAIISYHSGEDRLVKNAFREWSASCICPHRQMICTCRGEALGATLTKRPINAASEEVSANPRARSAVMRAALRTSE